jgi:hypothetical protein
VTPYCLQHDFSPFAFFLVFQDFLNWFKYQSIDPLYLFVGLRIVHGCEGNLRFNLVVEILEHVIVEILGVVDYNVLRDAIAADDILREEIFNGYRAYVSDGLRLNQFRELFDCHNSEGIVAMCWC